MGFIKHNFITHYVINFFKKIKLNGLYGFSLYELFKLYFIGIIKGAIYMRHASCNVFTFLARWRFFITCHLCAPTSSCQRLLSLGPCAFAHWCVYVDHVLADYDGDGARGSNLSPSIS